MSSLGDRCREKIHNRRIEISTYATDESDSIVVEGVLKDDRMKPSYTFSGDQRPPGVVHHMIIRMQVGQPALTIQAIEVEMPGTPRSQCRETIDSLQPLVGRRIVTGFTDAVKQIAGGNKGCAHLTTLMIVMGPAAVQGYWAHFTRSPMDADVPHEILQQFLADTCRVWRKDGPLMKELVSEVAAAKNAAAGG